MSRWIDASLSISSQSVVWPGDLPLVIQPTCQMSKGQPCNESRIEMGSHCGTHIDAPRHFDDNGHGVDELEPEVLVGPAWVVESMGKKLVSLEDIESIPDGEFARVILKTRNSAFLGEPVFQPDYVGLAEDAARYLVERGCRLVGTDYYSICPFDDVITIHTILLSNGVAIIEALVLKDVPPGPVELIALPLKITSGDASPARVLIRERALKGTP